MPEFELKRTESPVQMEFGELEPFTQGYIEALFFTSDGPGVTTEKFLTPEYQEALREGSADGSLPGDVGFSDLHPDTLETIISECAIFRQEADELLKLAYSRNYEPAQAGRDFWFTRNGHGVGFWDREPLKGGELGDKLSEVARRFGETNAFFGNEHVEPDSCVHLD